MRNILLLMLICAAASADAAEQQIRSACSLASSTEITLSLKVVSGKDACIDKRCFASTYDAMLIADVSPELKKGQSISFTTSAPIQIGEKYRLFADKIGSDQRAIVFRGAGYDETYEVPETVGFYVPVDGAFLIAGNSYYRTISPDCEGEASECSTMRRFSEKEILKADVLATGVERAVTCKASGEGGGEVKKPPKAHRWP